MMNAHDKILMWNVEGHVGRVVVSQGRIWKPPFQPTRLSGISGLSACAPRLHQKSCRAACAWSRMEDEGLCMCACNLHVECLMFQEQNNDWKQHTNTHTHEQPSLAACTAHVNARLMQIWSQMSVHHIRVSFEGWTQTPLWVITVAVKWPHPQLDTQSKTFPVDPRRDFTIFSRPHTEWGIQGCHLYDSPTWWHKTVAGRTLCGV